MIDARTFAGFPLTPAEVLAERTRELRAWGIPERTIAEVGPRIRGMWDEGPTGWTGAWAAAAEAAERAGRPLEAAMLYGAARFPCASGPGQAEAYARQLAAFERAARRFPCYFERRVVQAPWRGGTTPVPAHLYAAFWHGRDHRQRLPIVVLSGGTCTGKVELHRLALGLVLLGGFLVVAMDLPGTGESRVALAPDADDLYAAVLRDFAHDLDGERPLAAFGLGFGGWVAARLALRGLVDAAVAAGAPVGAAPLVLPTGRAGPLARALGLPALPDAAAWPDLLAPFALPGQACFTDPAPTPLLAFNGARDPWVPAEDLAALAGLPHATTWAFADAGHAAGDRLARVAPAAIAWLRAHLRGEAFPRRLVRHLANAARPVRGKPGA